MLTLTQLAQLRDSTITYAERAAVWREACEIRTTQADAEQVVFFLQGQHDNNIVLTTAAREINKYLDQTARIIEHKTRAIAALEDNIDELRGKIKGKDEGLARLQGEIVTLQAEITGLRHDITEHEERSDITEHEARSAVEIKGLKQQLTRSRSTSRAKLGDLQREIRQLTAERNDLKAERNDLKAERDALLAKNRERADRSGEEYAKSVDYTGLGEAAKRLRMHTHAGPSPDFLEDTQLPDPSADPDLDPEVLVISEVLPCLSDLDFQARRRVLRYLTDRLVTDRIVDDAL